MPDTAQRSPFIVPSREYALDEPQIERWPLPQAAMFIFLSGSACWGVIIGVITWILN